MADALDPAVLSRINTLLRAGNRLLAVREYRSATGAGLQQAVAFIDALESGQATAGPVPPELLDAALLQLLPDSWPKFSHSAPPLPPTDPAWLGAMAQARALCAAAYDCCDKHRAGNLGFDAILGELRARCPGFSPAAYEQARSYGMFASR